MSVQTGAVYLVGAGPGDPGLITVRGLALLRRADVVVHDRLIGRELLAEVRRGAEVVDVGKARGEHKAKQDWINELLVDRARLGDVVVRLKGGDPFVFGRGFEELSHCRDADVPCSVVPGVSSAIAGPTAAGVPITQRKSVRSFAVVTATTASESETAPLDYAALAKLDLVVVLMGRENLASVTKALIDAGRAPNTPAACVAMATTPLQRVVKATLGTIADAADHAGLMAPVVTVIGDAASHAEEEGALGAGPLCGKRIVVTRPTSRQNGLRQAIYALGGTVVPCPLIEIVYPDWPRGDRSLGDTGGDSSNNPDNARASAVSGEVGSDASPLLRSLASPLTKGGSRGNAVDLTRWLVSQASSLLHGRGLSRQDACGTNLKSTVLGSRGVLQRCKNLAQPLLGKEGGGKRDDLLGNGIGTHDMDGLCSPEELIGRFGDYDWILFASVHGVRGFWRLLRAYGLDARALAGAGVGAVGPVTASALKRYGIEADLVPSLHTGKGLLDAITEKIGGAGARVLYPCGNLGGRLLVDGLRDAGAAVDGFVVYDNVPTQPPKAAAELIGSGVDAIAFCSPSAVRAFVDSGIDAGRAIIACIGPTTAAAVTGVGMSADVIAEQPTAIGLAGAIADHFDSVGALH